MLGRIVDIAADGADVFAGRRLEDDFADGDDGRRIVEIDDALLRVAFQRFGRVSAEIHRRASAAKSADTVEGFARSGRADDLGVRERAQFARVVGVLVGDENLRDLLRLVAEIGKRFEIGLDLRTKIDSGVRVGRRFGEFGGEAGIDEDDFAAGGFLFVV